MGRRGAVSERPQILYQVALFCFGEVEGEQAVVVVDDLAEGRCACVVEVRWVLPDATERGGAVHAGGSAHGEGWVEA